MVTCIGIANDLKISKFRLAANRLFFLQKMIHPPIINPVLVEERLFSTLLGTPFYSHSIN